MIAVDQGGADRLSESRLQLIRRFAGASALAEQVEAKLANGEKIDIAEYTQLASTLVRIASRLGIDRKPKDITPSLSEYIAGLPNDDCDDPPAGTDKAEQ